MTDPIGTFEELGSAHEVASMRWIASLLADDGVEATRLADVAVMRFRSPGPLRSRPRAGRAGAGGDAPRRSLRRGGRLGVSVELVAGSGNAGCTSHNLETIAAYAAERGRMEEASWLVTAAAALREATGHGYRV